MKATVLRALILALVSFSAFAQTTGNNGIGGGGVSKLIAGSNVTLSPTNGLGAVTITASSTASTAFSALTSSTNNSLAGVCGTGCSLSTSGSGLITATGLSTVLGTANGGTGATTLAGAAIPVFTGAITSGHCVEWASANSIEDAGSACGSGGSPAFSAITSATNTSAAMVVGSGASLGVTGSGTIAATSAPLAGITGLGTGVETFLATPSSANFAAAVTGETGTGALVFGTSPSITSPTIVTGETLSFITGSTQCLHVSTSGVVSGTGSDCGSGGSTAFSAITTGSNTTAAMTVGSGGSIAVSGSGSVEATSLSALSGLPTIATQTVMGNGSGSTATPVALALSGNLVATASGLGTSQPLNTQTGTTYTMLATDAGKLATFSNASSVAVSLPVASTTGFTAGYSFDTQNDGAGNVTFTPTTSTVDGLASVTFPEYSGCTLTSDSTNYHMSACPGYTPFAALRSSTNTWAAMLVGTGASLATTGSGTIIATSLASTLGTSGGGTGATSLAAANIPVWTGSLTATHCAEWSSSGVLEDSGATCGGGGSSAFSALTTSTNTTATMTVGTGGTITVSGSGVNNANEVDGAAPPISAGMTSTNSSGQIVAQAVVAATAATGPTNDYSPSSFGPTTGVLYLTPTSGGSTLDGLVAQNALQQVYIVNAEAAGGADNILLVNQSSSDSTAANRFLTSATTSLAIPPGGRVLCVYLPSTVSRWSCQ